MARRLKQMMEDVRARHDHHTIWLCSDLKKTLCVHWEIDEGFKRRYLTNRANRTSAKSSKYTSGHDVKMAETFKYTDTLKKRFAYQRFADHYETKDDGNNSDVLEVDFDTVWRETASEPYKNRVYGLGLFFGNNLYTSTLGSSSASATSQPVNPEDGVDLREQVLEITWNLHQHAQHIFPQAKVEVGVEAALANGTTDGGTQTRGSGTVGGSVTTKGAPTSSPCLPPQQDQGDDDNDDDYQDL
ncbi:hypothetical protein Ahy_B06g084736 [Arachis hypogaea]|uniref:Uncharacterized protein n=1 Tax=Arachis hypogaea TaxID=3818 RepID=A0A444YSM7_ARAHY|nr:hypothetical protein Ahy_B06g084736 [Arachis hypogaea]